MEREEPGDFHPIINEWEGEWVVPEPGEGMLLPGSSDQSQWEELGRLPYIPTLILRCLTHEGGSSYFF
jgi:hypothetical protein